MPPGTRSYMNSNSSRQISSTCAGGAMIAVRPGETIRAAGVARVADAAEVGREVVRHQAAVVAEAVRQQQLQRARAEVPGGRSIPGGRPAADAHDRVDPLLDDRLFLVTRERV